MKIKIEGIREESARGRFPAARYFHVAAQIGDKTGRLSNLDAADFAESGIDTVDWAVGQVHDISGGMARYIRINMQVWLATPEQRQQYWSEAEHAAMREEL